MLGNLDVIDVNVDVYTYANYSKENGNIRYRIEINVVCCGLSQQNEGNEKEWIGMECKTIPQAHQKHLCFIMRVREPTHIDCKAIA